MPRLLVVHHTPSPSMHSMFNAVLAGASNPEIAGVEIEHRAALTATASDVLAADGYVLGSPANLGYISGALKHFFDQIYYPCLEETTARPFGVYLHGNDDTGGALRAVEKITTGLQWRQASAQMAVVDEPSQAD
ncbi:MAG: flavodoxin family protein, partial [Acidimicrobiales bacterium]